MKQSQKIQRLENLFSEIKKKVEGDGEFRQRLETNPFAALKEFDRGDEETKQLLELLRAEILNKRDRNRELDLKELDVVAGGGFVDDFFYNNILKPWTDFLHSHNIEPSSGCSHR
ncbi:hypothetical protein [Thiorhodovibrio frisius]|uniref:Uncharacterized protein n=1 Tax=Thiorhodovibrio frisius TaxID=631362 RepID=H8Z1M6_9GAMM|nr:hypothetical protein [Thiorhodovibrio frisius]EIC21471.1 hypothetical protein Thi970DRAFT_01682 [Thiorhodovibrio frisius]WPL24057.1 hypothetical protein Thiofri_04269 [Thiorhodovibrio frisius]